MRRLDVAHTGAGHDQFVAGDLVLDAELLQVAFAQTGAGALQTALRLGLRGGCREALFDLAEALCALGASDGRHGDPLGRIDADAHLEPDRRTLGQATTQVVELLGVLELVEVGQAVIQGEFVLDLDQVDAVQVGADRQGCALAAGHRMDRRLGAGDGVAGSEHAGVAGAASIVVGFEHLPA